MAVILVFKKMYVLYLALFKMLLSTIYMEGVLTVMRSIVTVKF